MKHSSRNTPLTRLTIAAPCSVEWNAMQGDERVRLCGQCEKNVYNLIGMSEDEANALLANREGQACIRAYQRSDGTLMTKNCPVGLRKLRQRMAWGFGGLAAGFAMLLSGVTFGLSGRVGARVKRFEPFQHLARLVKPVPIPPAPGLGLRTMGSVNTLPIFPTSITVPYRAGQQPVNTFSPIIQDLLEKEQATKTSAKFDPSDIAELHDKNVDGGQP